MQDYRGVSTESQIGSWIIVGELGVLREECEVYHPRRSIPVFGDDNLRHPFTIYLLIRSLFFPILCFALLRGVQVSTVDHQDQIGILFDGSRFPKIGKNRSPVRSTLHRPTELRKSNNRYIQFLGE